MAILSQTNVERQAGRYAWVPEEAFAIPENAAFRVYAALVLHADRDGICFPGQETLAKLSRRSVRSVRYQIAWLQKNGWLTLKKRRRDTALYRLLKTGNRLPVKDLQDRQNRVFKTGNMGPSNRPVEQTNTEASPPGDFPAKEPRPMRVTYGFADWFFGLASEAGLVGKHVDRGKAVRADLKAAKALLLNGVEECQRRAERFVAALVSGEIEKANPTLRGLENCWNWGCLRHLSPVSARKKLTLYGPTGDRIECFEDEWPNGYSDVPLVWLGSTA